MKARTVLQRKVVWLSEKWLPEITLEQKIYGFKNGLDHKATILKSGKISCLDCGHTWQSSFNQNWKEQIVTNICPNCKVKIKIEQTRKKRFYEWSYMGIITTCYEFQVIRLVKISGNYFAGKPADLRCLPLSEVWMTKNKKKFEVIGFNQKVSYGYNSGCWIGDWTLRSRSHLQSHTIAPFLMYPEKKVTPWIKRNGFKNSTLNVAPYNLFRKILDYSEAETLIKAKQNSLLVDSIKDYHGMSNIKHHWKQIKIAMRNGYIVKDATMWYDYLGFCSFFNIDTLKAKNVCPKDLRAEHNRLMHDKQVIDDEANRLLEIKNHEEALKLKKEKTAFFRKNVKRFASLLFSDNEITITAIKSMKQVKEEGLILHHCVYTSEYHLKLDTFLMTAHVNGEPKETIQICLKTFTVLQARGFDNKNSKYYTKILKLMNRNLHQIRNVVHPKKSSRKPRGEMVEAA